MTTKFYCCVPGCRFRYARGREHQIQLFNWPDPSRYPSSVHLQNLSDQRVAAWDTAVRERFGGSVSTGRICSKHFVTGQPAKLTSTSDIDWIPTLFDDLDNESCSLSMDSMADVSHDDEEAVDMQDVEDQDNDNVISQPSNLPTSNSIVGPENGAIRCLFKIALKQFVGQRIASEGEPIYWLIRAHSIEAFRAYLWELAVPFIQQTIKVETDNNGQVTVGWGDSVPPTIEQADHYISFTDKKLRKNYRWKQLTNSALEKWHNSSTFFVCIHVHSMAVYSRVVYGIVMDQMLRPKTLKPKQQPRGVLPPEADGYSFQDEVRAIRETFLQMRDLMLILDNRITLLERKCGQSALQEPMIPTSTELTGAEATDVKHFSGDPLYCEVVKEEPDEDDYL